MLESLVSLAASRFSPPEACSSVEEYWVEGWAGVRLRFTVCEEETGRLVLHVEEPPLTGEAERLYVEAVRSLLYRPPVPGEGFRERLARQLQGFLAAAPGSREAKQSAGYYLLRDLLGAGWVDPLLRDPRIEDVSLNGPGLPAYVVHRDYGSMRTTLVLSAREMDMLVQRLAQLGGRHVSLADPIVDASLPGGHRLAATFRAEVSARGSSLTIRKFREKPFSLPELVKLGTLDPILAGYLWEMMEHRRSGLVLGVTGSGKTTLLNAVADTLHPDYKIVTIEDTPEIRLEHENWVQLVSRPPVGGSGEVSLYQLVRVALRYRPDVIIVGEVRGEEAYVLFQAIATGHGGLSTLHAESWPAAAARLTSPPMNIPEGHLGLLGFAVLVRRVPGPGGRAARRVAAVWEPSGTGAVEVSRLLPAENRYEHRLPESRSLRGIASERGVELAEVLEEVAWKSLAVSYAAERSEKWTLILRRYYGRKTRPRLLREVYEYAKSRRGLLEDLRSALGL